MNGHVILATPSGARPAWLAQKYPEVLRTDNRGNKRGFGGRLNHCLTSPIYRKKVYEINTKLAELKNQMMQFFCSIYSITFAPKAFLK